MTKMFSNKVLDPDIVDAGKRASDHINIHINFGQWSDLVTKWMAVKLADGGSDGVLYDSFREAASHQFSENLCAYFTFKSCGGNAVTARDIGLWLQFWRDAYKAGIRAVDPEQKDGGKMPLMTAGQNDYYRGLLPSPESLPKDIQQLLRDVGAM